MDSLTNFLVVLFGLSLFHALNSIARMRKSKLKNHPPGPPPLPIIGNLHLLGEHYHKSLAELAKKYGPIMTIKLGHLNLVTITSPAMAKQVLQKQDVDFSGKWIPKALHAHSQFKYSVVLLPVATRWRNLRRFMNSTMFSGARLDVAQHVRDNKVEELVEYCRRYGQRGEAVDISTAAFMTTLNALTSTVFSKNVMDPNLESSVQEMRDIMWNVAVEAGAPNLADYYLFLKFDVQGITRRLTGHFSKVLALIYGPVNERIEQRKKNKNIRFEAAEKNKYRDSLDLLLDIIEENPEDLDRAHMERQGCLLFMLVLVL